MRNTKKSFNRRAVVSIILFAAFLLLPVSAAMIHHHNPRVGHIAHVVHELAGIVFTIAGIFHIVFNWRTFKSYLKKIYTCLLFLLFGYSSITAQEHYTFNSLDELFRYAEENSVTFKNASHQTLMAKYQTLEAKLSMFNLRADATFSATDNLKQAINYIPSEIFGGEPGTYRAITMGQQYVSSGIISPQFDLLNPYAIARVKVSKTNEQLTMITNQLNKKDLYETISACYHNILSYQRQLKVLNESLANADTLSFIMQQKNKEGIARVQDVNNSLANVLSVKDRIQQTEIMLNQEYNNMKLLCDMDKNITVEIIPGIIPPQFNASLSANSSLEEQRAESQLKYDLATLKANKMIFLPTIGFFSEFGWHQYTNNRFFDKNTWFNANYIGLKLTIPIFPSISGISAVKYSKVNMRMDKNNLNHSRLQDSMNNRKLESDYQKAFNSYLLLTEIEGLKKDSYKRNLLVYQEGLLSSNDLFVSFNEWIDSSMNTVSQWAVSEYMMSKIMITNTFN